MNQSVGCSASRITTTDDGLPRSAAASLDTTMRPDLLLNVTVGTFFVP